MLKIRILKIRNNKNLKKNEYIHIHKKRGEGG